MRRVLAGLVGVVGLLIVGLGLAAPAAAALAPCPADSVRSGTICSDKYEASVWDLTAVPASFVVGGRLFTKTELSIGS